MIEKFRYLSQDATLLKAIPDESKWKNPSIKTAQITIKEGDICVENIHAAYEKTNSSIKDSFSGNGERTLVLNDECHHIFNPIEGRDKESQSLKKWKELLLSLEYNFKYILGFTGTAYIKDEYFNDVIYRYSLRQAVNDKVVKMVDYVSKNDDADPEIKFQEIHDNHRQNANQYRKIKPLTILVTKDITAAKRLVTELSEFLMDKEELDAQEVEEKVLIVTSANEHKANIRKLKEVDDKVNKVEWIVSVSMLTEGWDVKNVFQIVPWEDRAFNSKLLASFNLISIGYNADANSPVAFEMLESLKRGKNLTWELNIQKNLSGNLQISLGYQGRKPQSERMIHTASVQARAIF